jgi:predicted phage tail protein
LTKIKSHPATERYEAPCVALSRRTTMSERIDQFCEDLRVKLTAIDENMQALKTEIEGRRQPMKKSEHA